MESSLVQSLVLTTYDVRGLAAMSVAVLVLVPLAMLCGSALVCAFLLPRMRRARSEKVAEEDLFGAESSAPLDAKLKNFRKITSLYYDVATPFFLQMWGEGIHFAPRHVGESWEESMRRYEHFLALRLHLGPGMSVVDAGCGVGGPARSIARFSGARVTGVNINALQCRVAEDLNREYGVPSSGDGSVRIVEADFTKLPMATASFDAVYAVEATCHAPDRREVFAEIYRVLKPGCHFACYEWIMTEKFDPSNAAHCKAKLDIEVGNGIALLSSRKVILDALLGAGFELEECEDKAETSQVEWYLPSKGEWPWTLQSWKSSSVGFIVLFLALWFQHLVGLIPHTVFKGLATITRGPVGLVRAAEVGIFTPMLFIKARKPVDGASSASATTHVGSKSAGATRRRSKV
jgi:sterol 24-C-methyltransferase